MKKLKLNKEKIAQLTNSELAGVNGGAGKSNPSTEHTFTCCWCNSNTDDDPGCPSYTCSTQDPNPQTCPPTQIQ